MKSSIVKASIVSAVVLLSGYVSAEAPKVPTAAPYIVLTQNLDEPNGYGFCLDTFGAGQSELMHTHTCKPKRDDDAPRNHSGHDVRFEYNAETKQVVSYAYENQCMQVLLAKGKTEFALLECSDHAHQKFAYNAEDQTLRLDKDQEKCIAIGTETIKAGPWVKRVLQLVDCKETDATLKQWTVVAK